MSKDQIKFYINKKCDGIFLKDLETYMSKLSRENKEPLNHELKEKLIGVYTLIKKEVNSIKPSNNDKKVKFEANTAQTCRDKSIEAYDIDDQIAYIDKNFRLFFNAVIFTSVDNEMKLVTSVENRWLNQLCHEINSKIGNVAITDTIVSDGIIDKIDLFSSSDDTDPRIKEIFKLINEVYIYSHRDRNDRVRTLLLGFEGSDKTAMAQDICHLILCDLLRDI